MIKVIPKKNYLEASISFTSAMSSITAMKSQVVKITTLLSVCGDTQMKMDFWTKYSTQVGINLFISTSQLLETTTQMQTFCNNWSFLRTSSATKCKTDSLAYPKATMNYLTTSSFWLIWALKLIHSKLSSMEKCSSSEITTKWKMNFCRKRRNLKMKSGSLKSKRNNYQRRKNKHKNYTKRKARLTQMLPNFPHSGNKSILWTKLETRSKPKGRNSTKKS